MKVLEGGGGVASRANGAQVAKVLVLMHMVLIFIICCKLI